MLACRSQANRAPAPCRLRVTGRAGILPSIGGWAVITGMAARTVEPADPDVQ